MRVTLSQVVNMFEDISLGTEPGFSRWDTASNDSSCSFILHNCLP